MATIEVAQSAHDQDDYNAAAIRTAELLGEIRAARRAERAGPTPPRDQLFPSFNTAGLGVAREWERMGGRHVSESLQTRAGELGARFEHLGLTIGTVIHDLDLAGSLGEDDDDTIAFVRAALLERKVVFFRDQHLTEDQQVAFGRRFGDLDAFPFGPPGDNPFILEIRHGETSPGTENSWHTDVTWMERPSLGSIAQLIAGPPEGGDTLFSDSHAAYLGLPDDLRDRIQHLAGINDYRIFMTVRGPDLGDEVVDAIKDEIPFGVSHPLCRTHPETGKTALYLHGGFLRHDSLYDVRTDEPLDAEESSAIVRRLLEQHARPEYTCRFRWEPGSIAFWDNRAAQHYATSDYFPHERLLRRVTVSGDRPYYDPPADEVI